MDSVIILRYCAHILEKQPNYLKVTGQVYTVINVSQDFKQTTTLIALAHILYSYMSNNKPCARSGPLAELTASVCGYLCRDRGLARPERT